LSLILALLATAVICLLSVLPGSAPTIQAVPEGVQKAMHLVAYAVLAALWSSTLVPLGLAALDRSVLAWGLAVSIGGLLELVQRYRPGRYGSWSDVARNAAGATIGTAIIWWI